MTSLRERWRRLRRLLLHDIWHLSEPAGGGHQAFLLRLARIVLLAARGFAADGLHLRASALTYYTLLSIVPALALAFGVAKGFGLEDALEQALRERLAGQEAVLERVLAFARSLLANTRGGLVAGVGVAFLLWSVVRLLNNVEAAFNGIWGVARGRSPARKLADFLAIAVLAPVLLLASSSGAVFVSGRVDAVLSRLGVLEPVGALLRLGVELLPYVFVWLLLTLLYLAVPNTVVSWRAGLAAGLVAGTLYQALQFGYFRSVLNVARYNAIYGSFAALPLLLVWLHLSWLVVLMGAEVSFAVDNVGDYARERAAGRASHHERRLVALGAAVVASERFLAGRPPATAAELAERLEAPTRLVQGAVETLVEVGVLSAVAGSGERAAAYQPAVEPASLTLAGVAAAFDDAPGHSPDATAADREASDEPAPVLARVDARWRDLARRAATAAENDTLAAMARAEDDERA